MKINSLILTVQFVALATCLNKVLKYCLIMIIKNLIEKIDTQRNVFLVFQFLQGGSGELLVNDWLIV